MIEDAWDDSMLRQALVDAVRPGPCMVEMEVEELTFKSSLELCTSFRITGCILCWWTLTEHRPECLAEHLRLLLDDVISRTVAKTGLHSFQRRGVTFPLREGELHELVDCFKNSSLRLVRVKSFAESWGARAWTYLAMLSLNRLAGCEPSLVPGRWSCTERRAAMSILEAAERCAQFEKPLAGLTEAEWRKDLGNRQVGYTGEEIDVCHQLTWEQILPALPPEEHGGCIDALDWVGAQTRHFLLHPELLLKDHSSVDLPRMPGKIHMLESDKNRIAKELVRRRVCDWIPLESVYSVKGTKVLNGVFGVKKPSTLADGRPILRFIMNLTGSNSTQEQLEGGCNSLPAITAWQSIVLEEGERLSLFQSDMSSAFYLFRIPGCWKKHLSFNIITDGADVGLTPNVAYALCCSVIPMGWLNSVGIMQEISENLLHCGRLNKLGQVMRGKNLPVWFNAILDQAIDMDKSWWHVYLDNFCAGERLKPGESSVWGLACHQAAELAWKEAGVVSSEKKRVSSAEQVTELGAHINGEAKTLGVPLDKLLNTVISTLYLLSQPLLNKKHLQIIAGRWMFILQFRRPGMIFFDALWKMIGGNCRITAKLRHLVRRELWSAVTCSFLFHCNLGAPCSDIIAASDASTTGGAFGISKQLSDEGRDFLKASEVLERTEGGIPCPILLVSLFNGIGGAFRAYDVASILPMGRIACELDQNCNRICQRRWPGTIFVLDVRSIDRGMVRGWARQFLRVKEVHLWSGSPCNDLSAAKAGRMNLNGPCSGLFFEVPRIRKLLEEEFGEFVIIKNLLENVASMDQSAAGEISETLRTVPYRVDCVDAVPMRRPRFAWSSVSLEAVFPDVEITQGRYWREVSAKTDYPFVGDWLEPGFVWEGGKTGHVFPTCMKSIPRDHPPFKPAGLERCSQATVERWTEDSFRYPPYQYGPGFAITSESSWRLLRAEEKELLLGYGLGHTLPIWSASKQKSNRRGYDDARHSALGESFSIFSFVLFAVAFCRDFLPIIPYKHMASRMGLAPGFRAPLKFVAPIKRKLQYGSATAEASLYTLGMSLFNRMLLRKTNHTGSDVRLTTGEFLNKKIFPRQSVAAAWWIWDDVHCQRWSFKSHINVLELQSVLNALRFQIERLKVSNMRIFQLSDSYICISVVSKGRSSSFQLNRLLRVINAHLLAHGLQLIMGHVDSTDNPTDAGSRL